MADATIEVWYREVQATPLATTYHKDIIYNDGENVIIIGAAPDRTSNGSWFDPGPTDGTVSLRGISVGQITFTSEEAMGVVRDRYADTEVVAQGTSAEMLEDFNEAYAALQQIAASNTGYHPTISNSNWSADIALARAGISQPRSDGILGNLSPGSLNILQVFSEKLFSGQFNVPQQGDVFNISPGSLLTGLASHCFLEDSSVQMWPLDPSIKPRLDGSYDEELVLSKVWYKRQDQMQVGDLVVSYDKQGRLQPGPVVRTMTNTATHILDFWGTGVTPGHAYHCADGPIKGGFAPIMDILRMDGALMRSNGTMFRSTTNCDVGSMGDMMIHAAATMQKPDGSWTEPKPGRVRFGTRIILPDGRDTSLMELAHEEGWKVTDDGYMVGQMRGGDGIVEERAFHFPYRYGAELPKPEDYILKRSAVTLEEIYLANEWEQIGTRMPAPDSLAGFNPNSTMKCSKPKPNIPPAFANRPDAPTAQAQTQRPAHASASPSAPSMNRKQRKAMKAKQRKAAKTRKKLAS